MRMWKVQISQDFGIRRTSCNVPSRMRIAKRTDYSSFPNHWSQYQVFYRPAIYSRLAEQNLDVCVEYCEQCFSNIGENHRVSNAGSLGSGSPLRLLTAELSIYIPGVPTLSVLDGLPFESIVAASMDLACSAE